MTWNKTMSDYYKQIYSQRDVDLIRGDLMRRIAELVARDEKVQELVEAVDAMQIGACSSTDLCYIEEVDPDAWGRVLTIASQLKEQDDED